MKYLFGLTALIAFALGFSLLVPDNAPVEQVVRSTEPRTEEMPRGKEEDCVPTAPVIGGYGMTIVPAQTSCD
jgi:hypothetical protein